jgi:hypothetical protein
MVLGILATPAIEIEFAGEARVRIPVTKGWRFPTCRRELFAIQRSGVSHLEFIGDDPSLDSWRS